MILYKALRKLITIIRTPIYTPLAKISLALNGASWGKNLIVRGRLKVVVTKRGKLNIGRQFRANSGENYNVIGRQQKTTFWVDGNLSIGDFVGMSSTAIICTHSISIGNHVIIGGNTVIYDTDFHSLNPEIRGTTDDKRNAQKKPVIINDHVFIGAHTTILKGVTIGENSIIGACSVITKDIPANEIWAGNPARFIKRIYKNQ